jgi:tetratricopeptide (TPR) repeat protein
MAVTPLGGDREPLLEERDFFLRSLQDLDREYEAGDIEADDYAALKDDYTSRAAAVLRRLAELEGLAQSRPGSAFGPEGPQPAPGESLVSPAASAGAQLSLFAGAESGGATTSPGEGPSAAGASPQPQADGVGAGASLGGTGGRALPAAQTGWRRLRRPPRHRWMWWAALVVLVAGGAVLAVNHFTSPRIAGQVSSGSQSGIGGELQEANGLSQTDPVQALRLYGKILGQAPNQPVALTGEAVIYAETGFASRALTALNQAEKADPSYASAHFYRGLVLLDQKQPAGAKAEIEWYLAHDPDPASVATAKAALAQANAELSPTTTAAGK